MTIKASEALEEALCFGRIDGQMKSIDELSYKNIFPNVGNTANGLKKTRSWLNSLNKTVL